MSKEFKPRPEILLHPNIPKPLHGMAPRVIKGKAWWDEQRQIAYAKTGYRCAACGICKKDAKYHQWLEAHELYDINYKRGTMTMVEIVALCHSCHNYIHSGRMGILLSKGEMSESKVRDILRHGDKILEDANLKKPEPPTKLASWGRWRLVLEGKEYKGNFDTEEDFFRHYNIDLEDETW